MRKLDESKKALIHELISERADVLLDDINHNSKLDQDLDIDSIDKIELLMDIEREFNICIPDADFEEVETVSDVYKIVERYF